MKTIEIPSVNYRRVSNLAYRIISIIIRRKKRKKEKSKINIIANIAEGKKYVSMKPSLFPRKWLILHVPEKNNYYRFGPKMQNLITGI